MKRALGGLLIGFVAVFGLVPHAAASPSDFSFKSFDADYYLAGDSEARATLKTVETLVAEFPDYDQNHGIERAIPLSYDGHSTSLNIVSVTDEQGNAVRYTTSQSSGNEVLRIGNADQYVHGENTYVITYTQRDVTKYFADQKDDEFYWDTNGTGWQQAFGSVTARIHLADSIAPTFTHKLACYQGMQGSSAQCGISAEGNVITATASSLGPGENMTVAVGFTPGTFRGYQPTLWDRIYSAWIVSLVTTSIAGVAILIWLTTSYSARSNRTKELKPVVPEYIPPKGVSVLTSALIGANTRASKTAQIIDFAVRHYITIRQIKEKSLTKPAEYELEIVKSMDNLTQEEQKFAEALFGATTVGLKQSTKAFGTDNKIYYALWRNTTNLKKMIQGEYELRATDAVATRSFKRIGVVLVVISILTVSPVLFIVGITAFVEGAVIKPLTDKGVILRRYLDGLKVYIKAAEKDRIAMLQSPEGIEKTSVAIKDGEGGDHAKLINLYERVLPYAILFGQEKEWNKQLAQHYEQAGEVPDWYIGSAAFNAAAFTSSMNSFDSSLGMYSSSGGTGGGGFSGGGGGGGGGGGW